MTKDGAIPTDVSKKDPGEQETPEPVLSERELAMQEIEDQLSQQGAPEPDPESKPADGGPAPSPSLPEILSGDVLEKSKVKVKVDGQEIDLPLAEVVKGYQKDAVASRRLEQAAEERRKLEARQRELEEREKTLSTQAKPSPASDEDDGDVDAQIAAAMSALIDGDEEAATKALKSVLKGRGEKGPATPGIDEEAILTKAEQRLEQKRAEQEQAAAWQEFVDSNPAFADEASKERQYGDYLFATKYAPQIEAGEISYREALTRAAEEVLGVFKPEAPPPNPREEKRQRKAAIDNLPVAGARAVRQPEAEETKEDVLAEMARLRGQPV